MQTVRSRSETETAPWQAETVRLEEAVQRSLRECGHAPLWNVVCRVLDGTAVLTGSVPSFYMKQVAQTVAGQIDGVEQVSNRLDVASPTARRPAVAK